MSDHPAIKLRSIPGYTPWLIGSSAVRYAGAISTFAITLLAYALTGSASAAGALGTTRMLIAYGLAIFGGVVVDSYDRRRLMLIRATFATALWSITCALLAVDRLNYPIFFAIVCLSTVVGGILGSAGESALRSLVNKEYYVKARSINEGRDASAKIIGSPIAGFLYGVTQALPFVVSAIGNLIDLITTLFLPKLPPTSEAAAQESRLVKKVPFFSRAMAGFTWIARSRQMIGLTLIAAFSNFGSFLVVISVTLYLLSLGVSTTVIGLLSTAEAVGVLIGSALSTRISDKLPTGRLTLWANLISFAALVPIIFTQHPIAIGICYFIWGLPVAANSAAMGGYKFQMVSTDMQGRVNAADTLLVGLPVALTSILGGILIDAGLAIVSIAIGVAFTFLALATLGWERSILRIPRPSEWPDELPR